MKYKKLLIIGMLLILLCVAMAIMAILNGGSLSMSGDARFEITASTAAELPESRGQVS